MCSYITICVAQVQGLQGEVEVLRAQLERMMGLKAEQQAALDALHAERAALQEAHDGLTQAHEELQTELSRVLAEQVHPDGVRTLPFRFSAYCATMGARPCADFSALKRLRI